MNALTRHSLTKAALVAGSNVLSKSASATPAQAEIIEAAWPAEGTSKTAALAQVLASGLMIEEAEASSGA